MSLCQFRQFRISSAIDDGRELPDSLRSHIESCPACDQFLQRHQSLETALKGNNKAPEIPAWLHTKIMAKVNHADTKPSQAQSRWLPTAAGIAAIGIVFAFISVTTKEPDAPQPAVVQLTAPSTPVHPASVTNTIERHAKTALGNEFRDIAADISGARNFLTASFRSTIPGLREEE